MIYTDWANNEYRTKNKAFGGVSYYRIAKPAQYLKEWYDIDIVGPDMKDKFGSTVEEMWTKVFLTYDLVWTKQIDNAQAAAALLFFADYFKKPVVLDIDDNYFEVKPDQPGYQYYYPGSQKRAIFSSTISLVDALAVSTMPLGEYYKNHIKKVHNIDKEIFVLPNCNDIKDFPKPKKRKQTEKITIGYMGSITHNADLKLVMPIIDKLLTEFPNLFFEVLGSVNSQSAGEVFEDLNEKNLDRIILKAGTPSWDGYPELIAKQEWDIGIAPLVDDDFTRGKSHIKWMEYAMYKIPCVASKVYPYFQPIDGVDVINGSNGLVADNLQDWYLKLKNLIVNPALRQEMGDTAYEYVKNNWQYSQHAHKWKEAIDKILKK